MAETWRLKPEEVLELFSAGLSDAEVGERLGLRDTQVKRLRRSFDERPKYESVPKQFYPLEVQEWIRGSKYTRVNELAKKLNVRSHVIVALLPMLGLVDKKTHSSSLRPEFATKVLNYFSGEGEQGEGIAAYGDLVQVTLDFQRLLNEIALNKSNLFHLTPRQFEELIAEIWDRFGYSVELTAQTRDGGYDVVAIARRLADVKFLIECKRFSPNRKVSVGLVRALQGVKVHERATKAILATTSFFTDQAARFIEEHRWELEGRDQDGVVEWAKVARDVRKNPGSLLWLPA